MVLELARYVPLYSKILELLTNHKWKFYHVRKSMTPIGHKIHHAKKSYLELRGSCVTATLCVYVYEMFILISGSVIFTIVIVI